MRNPVKRVLLVGLLLASAAALVMCHESVLAMARDPSSVRDWLASLGPLGPLGLIILGALQVVVAPIPGFAVQAIAGYLFGWLNGAAYGAAGMLLGGALAMTLARVFGRPLVRHLVGDTRLERWERIAHLNSLGVWLILMVGPFGDWVYLLAGLTTVPVWKVMALAALVRVPAMSVAAGVGAGVISWRSPWVAGGVIVILIAGIAATRYQDRVNGWIEQHVLSRFAAAPTDAGEGGA